MAPPSIWRTALLNFLEQNHHETVATKGTQAHIA
jgi:hypothetical protein